MNSVPSSDWPKSVTATTLGWCSFDAARASLCRSPQAGQADQEEHAGKQVGGNHLPAVTLQRQMQERDARAVRAAPFLIAFGLDLLPFWVCNHVLEGQDTWQLGIVLVEVRQVPFLLCQVAIGIQRQRLNGGQPDEWIHRITCFQVYDLPQINRLAGISRRGELVAADVTAPIRDRRNHMRRHNP